MNDISILSEGATDLEEKVSTHTARVSVHDVDIEVGRSTPKESTEIDSPIKTFANTEYPFASLCRVGSFQGGAITLFRLADIVDGIIQPQRRNDAPNRDILFTQDRSRPENFVGVWSWSVNYNPRSGLENYVVSNYEKNLQPAEIILIPGAENIEDLKDHLLQGIELVPIGNKTLFAFTEADHYKALFCNATDLLVQNGQTQLKPEVISLPLYEFSYHEMVKLNGRIFFSHVNLDTPDSFLRIKDPVEAVKNAVLLRSPIAKLKSWVTIREARELRTFLAEMPTSDFYQEIADACACTFDEAVSYADEFIQRAEIYLQGNDIESEILESAIKHSPNLMEKCRALNEKAWQKENAAVLAEAQGKLADTAQELQNLQDQCAQLSLQLKQMEKQREKLMEEITEKQKLEVDVEQRVAARIDAARKNVSEFIGEMTFLQPLVSGQAAFTALVEQTTFQPGVRLTAEPLEHLEPWDVVCTIQEELAQAGVAEQYSLEFASYLYAAYISRTPLLLVGPNGRDIADALSASLFGKTASVLCCESKYSPGVVKECISDDGQIVTVVNPFNSNWINHISDITALSGKLIIAVHPFAEDLLIEPRGLYNYMLPILTEIFVDRTPTRNYAGGYLGRGFQNYIPAEPQRKILLAGKLSMSSIVQRRLKQILSDIKALSGNASVDIDILFGILPYAYVTGNSKMITEELPEDYPLSKAAQKIIRTIGDGSQ